MKAWTKACWAPLIAASFVAAAQADDMAVVHISDRPAPVPDPGPAAAPVANGAVAGAPCDSGACGPAACAGGGCYFNPTRGFRPYAAAPVYRDAVVYYRYWPDKWYGQPGFNLHPMFTQVYMPTDTTQQGFYYARVPQWMPNPNMYPPAPRPEDWHRHVIYAGGGECGGACNAATAGVSVGPGVGAGVEVNTPNPAPARPTGNWPNVPAAPSSPPPAAPAPHPMAPSAMNQGSQIQPASADGERHWLIDDIRNGLPGN